MEPKKKNTQRIVLIVVCVILALLLLVMIAGLVIANNLLGKVNRAPEEDYTLSQQDAHDLEQQQVDEEGTGNTAPVRDENDIIWDKEPSEIVGQDEEIINILLIGQDRRPGEGRARSDSMILCTFNKKDNTLTMTSFMRDMYVQIPGYQDTRINVAYALGGMELLDECLMVNFGLHVDGNVEVDFNGFASVVDALGGVNIDLTAREAGHLNNGSDWSLHEGVNRLTGEQALSYARIRALDSDFNRTNRQRNVLSSLLEESKNKSPKELWNLLNTLLPLVTTDLTDKEITTFATELIPMLSKMELVTQRIPIDEGYEFASIRGMSVLIPYLDVNRQFLIDTLSPGAFED